MTQMPAREIDARGKLCPEPVIMIARAAQVAAPGTHLALLTDDPVAVVDVPAWAHLRGHEVREMRDVGPYLRFVVQIRPDGE